MNRILGALICGFVFLGTVAGCGDRPPVRKKVKHGGHWDYEDEKHDDAKEKAETPKPKPEASPKPDGDAKKPE